MEKKPYHHIYKDGKLFAFRNLEGGPKRDPNFKWNWKLFREEKKKLKINYPPEHVIDRQIVLKILRNINQIHMLCGLTMRALLLNLGKLQLSLIQFLKNTMDILVLGRKNISNLL